MWGFQDWLSETGASSFPVQPTNFGPLLKQWLAEMKKAEQSKSNPRRFLPHEDYQEMVWMEGDVVKAASKSAILLPLYLVLYENRALTSQKTGCAAARSDSSQHNSRPVGSQLRASQGGT